MGLQAEMAEVQAVARAGCPGNTADVTAAVTGMAGAETAAAPEAWEEVKVAEREVKVAGAGSMAGVMAVTVAVGTD